MDHADEFADQDKAWVNTFIHIINRLFKQGLMRKAATLPTKQHLNCDTGPSKICAHGDQCTGGAQ
jgi:hypothetical protein